MWVAEIYSMLMDVINFLHTLFKNDVFFGWFLGIITIMIQHDIVAREKCCTSIEELKENLEKFNPRSICAFDREIWLKDISEVKKIILKLEIEKTGLFLCSNTLNDFLEKSNKLLSELNTCDSCQAYQPVGIAIRLLSVADLKEEGDEKFMLKFNTLDDVKIFLKSSFKGRLTIWMRQRVKKFVSVVINCLNCLPFSKYA